MKRESTAREAEIFVVGLNYSCLVQKYKLSCKNQEMHGKQAIYKSPNLQSPKSPIKFGYEL